MESMTGLLVEGGGMKCAYSAGVLDAFLDAGLTKFDYSMGVSAGAANLVSYLGGQRDRNRRFYVEHVTDPKYISLKNYLRTGNYFGLQYIYGDMTEEGGMDPADYEKYMATPTKLFFPATDGETGVPHYFSKDDLGPHNYKAIMATCALPVIAKPIEINGHKYFDGGVSVSIPVQKMVQDGCDKIVAILSKPRGFVMEPQGHRKAYTVLLKKQYPKIVEKLDNRHNEYNKEMKNLLRLEKEGKAFLFTPSGSIEMSTYTKDPEKNQKLYDEGLRHGREAMEKLREFLSK